MANIGKNAIENLTIGMYENDNIIFREYIQNSADSIDKAIKQGLITKEDAIIDINIDDKKKTISIHDNAMGVSVADFERKLKSIADSDKDRKEDKGFRGIGRLGGLACCDKLIFTSSIKDEKIKSTMIWDATLLRTILNDPNNHISASDLVDTVTSFKEETCEENLHFFEVELVGVLDENADLLNSERVCEYLEFVAPVPYKNTFKFQKDIYDFAKENNFKIDEYRILINSTQLFKPYSRYYYKNNEKSDEIQKLDFRKILSQNGEILAWMWYGVSSFKIQIDKVNKMRGIRIRKENIQVGNSETLLAKNFFKEPRGNYYFVGEIFAVSDNLIPNARRDYFNINLECRDFENYLKPITFDEFHSLYYYASKVKKNMQKINNYDKMVKEFQTKESEGKFLDKSDKDKALENLKIYEDETNKAIQSLQGLSKKAKDNDSFTTVIDSLQNEYLDGGNKVKDEEKTENLIDDTKSPTTVKSNPKIDIVPEKPKYITDELIKLNDSEKQIVGKIYSILKTTLPQDQSEIIIEKIQEELNK